MKPAPRLYTLSTVCLLKHYNQDYILHKLRTDFTGSNGVGKSIIADLFQIIFLADRKHIKFGTEGVNSKKRQIETLPYQSSLAYAFFNIEVDTNQYIALGAAIFAQGHTAIKPFIITSTIDIEKKREEMVFPVDKILYSKFFLRANGEAYTPEELASQFPETHQLYFHYFETREDRIQYYEWLYKNEILPINLTKDSSIKAFAKVIQSFSKAKTLEVDKPNKLIEYLFEEDENDITKDYQQQEQDIIKLLHNYRITKSNISVIKSKQLDLAKLKELDIKRQELEFKLSSMKLLGKYQMMLQKERFFTKKDVELKHNENKIKEFPQRSKKFERILSNYKPILQKVEDAHHEIAKSNELFTKLNKINDELDLLERIDTSNLLKLSPNNTAAIANKEAQHFFEIINSSKLVLLRYRSLEEINEKAEIQKQWLDSKTEECNKKLQGLGQIIEDLENASEDSLFIKTLLSGLSLNHRQRAIWHHFKNISFGLPKNASSGTRYVDSLDFFNNENIHEDPTGNGIWIKTGNLFEFISVDSIPANIENSTGVESLSKLIQLFKCEYDQWREKKGIYKDLENGIKPNEFDEYDYDTELSDRTKIEQHLEAAKASSLIEDKKASLRSERQKQLGEIDALKRKYDINDVGNDFQNLVDKLFERKEHWKNRISPLEKKITEECTTIDSIKSNLPGLSETVEVASRELSEALGIYTLEESSFKEKFPQAALPNNNTISYTEQALKQLDGEFSSVAGVYLIQYTQAVAKYDETKDEREISVNEQIRNKNFSYKILEEALLGTKIGILDNVSHHLETMNSELISIAEELVGSLTKIFSKTEHYYESYKETIHTLNNFFRGKLISNRFYFKINFAPNPKVDIRWIEFMRTSVHRISSSSHNNHDITPSKFIEDIYASYSTNKNKVTVEELLNPKRYFTLEVDLTDQNGISIPGSTGETYTAIALLGIARLSVVQDGERNGLRFLILEESATLDNANFALFPAIAEEYGYQIITMTPKPYALGTEKGWFIHQLIPGIANPDINYPKIVSYFSTNSQQVMLEEYFKKS